MLLLLVRHADAGQRDPAEWPDDRLRPLTDEGRKKQAKVTKALRRAELIPQAVLTSPWVRAAQTAEILVRDLGLREPAIESAALAAEPDLAALARDVGPRGERAIVALVGHSPWMEELATLLLTGESHSLRLDFPKSGVLGTVLDRIASGAGTLKFLLRPKLA